VSIMQIGESISMDSRPDENALFRIPSPYRAWCHMCAGEEFVPGIKGRGFMSITDMQAHMETFHARR